ncbi:hypothetical protein ACOM2C_00420 [Pseudarthrobacter sp. So.54]
MAAAALGAVAAWGTGVVCGLWWGLPGDTSANASIAFSLRSLAVLAIWPAATALAIFLSTIFTTPHIRPRAQNLPGRHVKWISDPFS